ncbi:FkbM family methyltransferase [Anabaena subtropica]|uniref:FkbM family methyltransferase n=1 Tax=Anabaena subtropica FACHB-260 TaxID=2692884 RepID=A0ABR8CSN2_9NOST|nr:FkbM family methyltransferase [Anabaena subtropica]MBD2345485.1 FkbM family methyltransferase [Anabaena subtropica FACHB-260]
MNISGISNKSFFGKLLRWPLNLIPPTTVLPILQGRLKGKQWITGSSQHGCWLGSYEYDKQILFEQTITEGSIVFDLGAHTGFYTLLASTLVGSQGKVFAFEPMPTNFKYLKQHLQLNRISNVTVMESAVSDTTGIDYFELNSSSFQGQLSSKGTLEVKTVSLDHLIAKGEIPKPNYIKIDVEGAEIKVLTGAKNMLMNAHPTIFLATHSDELHKQCLDFLTSLGYKIKPIGNKSLEESEEIIAFY